MILTKSILRTRFVFETIEIRIGGGTLIVCRDYLDPIYYPNQGNFFRDCEYTLISIKYPNINLDRILIISIYKPSDVVDVKFNL